MDFGPTPPYPWNLWINNEGLIAGTMMVRPMDPGRPDRAFLFDSRKGELTLLNPISPDSSSWAMGINNRGDVLGASFTWRKIEHMGMWSHGGEFQIYAVENLPTSWDAMYGLKFNDNNLIVIESADGNYYLMPKPNVRLKLVDLIVDRPSGVGMGYIAALNNHGDILGDGCNPCDWTNYVYDTFLLKRVGPPSKPLK